MPDKQYCESPHPEPVELPPGTGSKGGPRLCKACYSARTYSKKMGDAWLIQRVQTLNFWEGRAYTLAPIIAKNIKRVREQLAALHEETQRTAIARLRDARAQIEKKFQKGSGASLHH